MQRLSSFSHAWTHVVEYRAQSLLPCPFYHKSQSSEASNHKSTDEATIISLFADSASPSSSSRSHLTTLITPSSTSKGLPRCKWCSPSNALRQTTTKKISSMSPQWGRKSNIVTTSIFCTQGQYIKITICKRPVTLIEAKLMGFASY